MPRTTGMPLPPDPPSARSRASLGDRVADFFFGDTLAIRAERRAQEDASRRTQVSQCQRCHAPSSPSSRFCGSCGAPLVPSAAPGGPQAASHLSPKSSGTSVLRVALGVALGVGALWYFFPGVFDPSSPSVFGSQNRRSPLADVGGPRTVVNEVAKAREDQYVAYQLQLDVPSTVSIQATHELGPQIEIYVLDKAGYREFDAAAGKLLGGSFHHFEHFAGTVSRKEPYGKSGDLRAGDYVVLVDNTDFGDVAPPFNMHDDVSQVRLQVTVD